MRKDRFNFVCASMVIYLTLLSLLLLTRHTPLAQANVAHQAEAAPGLRQSILDQGRGEYLLYLTRQADLSAVNGISSWAARGEFVYNTLRTTAESTQANLLAILRQQQDAGNVQHFQSFFIANAILVRSNVAAFDLLAAHPDVAHLETVPSFHLAGMVPAPNEIPDQWNIQRVNAPQIWEEFSVLGQGAVVASVDTGVDYDHPALVNQYRGNLGGGNFDHNFNWYDPSNSCGNPGVVPCDNHNHGTHTMGIMVGNGGSANRIGMAPAASWIAVKACDENTLCPTPVLLQALQWILAPCPLSSEPGSPDCDPDLRPHVVMNAWASPAIDSGLWLVVVQNLFAAGIFPVFSAGISGPAPGTIGTPAAYALSFAVGATDLNDIIAPFSSRGPSPLTNEIKPDLTAPGVAIRSAINGEGYGYFSGSSIASAHVAGCYALLQSAFSSYLSLEDAANRLRSYAVDRGAPTPDYDYGYGRLDCYGALVDGQPGFILGTWPVSTVVCAEQDTGNPGSADFQIKITPIHGYTGSVVLIATVPPDFTASFSLNPVPVPTSASSIMTVGNINRSGLFRIDIIGADGEEEAGPVITSVALEAYDDVPGHGTLVFPHLGNSPVSLTPTFKWTAADRSNAYMLVVQNVTKGNLLYAFTTENSYQMKTPLDPSSTYIWSVQAYNPCGSGDFAPPSIFHTQDVFPATDN